MKNLFKILIPILACSNTVYAEETGITVKPKGSFDFSMGAIKDNGPKDKKAVTQNRKGFGFFSSAGVSINVENRLENDLAYGAKVALATSTAYDRRAPTMMYFESAAGKIELGTDKGATTKMKITGTTNSAASGGIWDMWITPDVRAKGIPYVTNTGNFVDAKTRTFRDLEYARKITYFTPEMKGFQAGISYTPDTTNSGHKTMKDPEYHMMGNVTPGYSFDIKDGVGWGLTQKFKVDDELSFKASLVGEFGKVIARDVIVTTDASGKTTKTPSSRHATNVKFKNLRTYAVGAEMKYADFAISGCYANFMKSLTSILDDPSRKKSDLYNIGAKYSFDKLSISLHYFTSDHRKNKLNATTLAADYKLAPGLLPYVEVTAFNARGRYKEKDEYFSDKHNGVLFLAGMKVEF